MPPSSEAFAMEADELFATASDTLEGMDAVQTAEQDAALEALKADLRRVAKDAEAARKAEKEPHLEAGRAVDAAYKPVATKCDKAIKAISDMQTPWRLEQLRIRDAAARKAREEAEAAEKAAQAKRAAPEHLQAELDADDELKAAAKLKAQANKIDRSATGLRTFKVVTVTDYRAAIKWLFARDPDALSAFIDEYARKNAPTRPMDGVAVTEERKAA